MLLAVYGVCYDVGSVIFGGFRGICRWLVIIRRFIYVIGGSMAVPVLVSHFSDGSWLIRGVESIDY